MQNTVHLLYKKEGQFTLYKVGGALTVREAGAGLNFYTPPDCHKIKHYFLRVKRKNTSVN